MFEEIARGRSQCRFSFFPFADGFLRGRWRREAVMPLRTVGTIAIPDAARSAFDHSAFDARSLDIDHCNGRLYAACDDATLVEMSSISGEVANVWPIAGPPDVTFFNPATGLVHVAIGEPGLVETFDPRTGHGMQTMTGADATHKMRRNGSSTTRSMRIAARW